ncbi:hypothetical protein CON65_15090 [Bacillus pseudomycoides]|uniref:Group-specific protein n=1 Tax=Bacillus pseudomycoides TaxID=64104 RepID=A0AA91ZSW7_9BACI|nr:MULTISPECIES: hypothetical protein [Bacillus]PEB51907.1 hypothetical protein COO03_14715 [Bacillus sp. AFS098217]PED81807.1 hypothetical protein CON65_15090 [Bacillus pseudomycoides]PEU15235.1 hypothetical protein CN525_17595 [Bacillus sp. AFS014408]PEU17837.1 hypothetical protein CN524_00860 [Bacillus sp. AFS019443]PFW58799.1 hypothetical protein COL20_25045 [Bacillus sp. AFS075034]
MTNLIVITLFLVAVTVVGTIIVGKNGDENYSKSTKGNITRLTMIYILLAIILIVGVGLYIYFNG